MAQQLKDAALVLEGVVALDRAPSQPDAGVLAERLGGMLARTGRGPTSQPSYIQLERS